MVVDVVQSVLIILSRSRGSKHGGGSKECEMGGHDQTHFTMAGGSCSPQEHNDQLYGGTLRQACRSCEYEDIEGNATAKQRMA